MALNIVHAVEFSRNGRTRVSASRPALRATCLPYHTAVNARPMKVRPDPSHQRHEPGRGTTLRLCSLVRWIFHLRLEITESQSAQYELCAFEVIWLRSSFPSARFALAFRPAAATCMNLRGRGLGAKSVSHPGRVAPVAATAKGLRLTPKALVVARFARADPGLMPRPGHPPS